MESQFKDTSQRMGELLKFLKENGYTVVVAGSVGAIPAMAAFLLLWEILEPHKQHIDVIRTASGSGIPGAFAASGMSAREIRERLLAITLKDIVEDIGLFAEHNEGQGFFGRLKDLKGYYFDAYKAASALMQHLTDGIGIVKGENIKRLLMENLLVNRFEQTYPKLEVVSTRFDTLDTFIFSHENTPNIAISDAVVASCAMRGVFAVQNVGGYEFVDAAHNESIPLKSTLIDHIKKGKDPKKLFIIGTFVHTSSRRRPEKLHSLSFDKHYSRDEHKKKFFDHRLILDYEGVPHLILELDAHHVSLPPPEPFPDFPEIGIGLRNLRKIIAKFFQKSQVEKYLRGVSIFLYEELNMGHLPNYINDFEHKITEKLNRHIPEIQERLANKK